MQNRKLITGFVTNVGLLLTGFVTVLSGFVIQIGYHMGHHGGIDKNSLVWGLKYLGWSNTHKISIVVLSLLAIIHFILHWKWYKIIIKKNLYRRNTTTVTLTILFLVVAVTGYFSWFVDLLGGDYLTRKIFIEIHDKVTLVLLPCLIIHTVQKIKWFVMSFDKLKKSDGIPGRTPENRKSIGFDQPASDDGLNKY
jgi:hypothetical protein